MTKVTVFALVLASLCAGQQPSYTVTFMMEPLEIFKGVFQARVEQVAMYEMVACNSGKADLELTGGQIMQMAHRKGLGTIDRKILSIAVSKGKRKSKIYKAYRTAYYLGWVASFLTVGGTIKATDQVKTGLLVLTQGAGVLKDEMDRRSNEAEPLVANFLDVKDQLNLKPGQCESKFILGMYRRDFKPIVVEEVTNEPARP